MPTLAIPAAYRVYVYVVYGIIGLLIGSTQVGYAAAEQGQPTWLVVALAVYAYVGGAIGYTAATHTPTTDAAEHYDHDGDGNADQAQG